MNYITHAFCSNLTTNFEPHTPLTTHLMSAVYHSHYLHFSLVAFIINALLPQSTLLKTMLGGLMMLLRHILTKVEILLFLS